MPDILNIKIVSLQDISIKDKQRARLHILEILLDTIILMSGILKEVLPSFVYEALRKGLPAFGEKMKGYFTREAVIVATESRTSSPVRIPRDPERLHHPQVRNLFPCGEGAGYAGGIVSAAMDGEKVADHVAGM